MPDLPSYAQLVERLGTFEYDVQPNAHGYLVSSRTDPSDVSQIRDLADLAELANLFAWRQEHQTRKARDVTSRT